MKKVPKTEYWCSCRSVRAAAAGQPVAALCGAAAAPPPPPVRLGGALPAVHRPLRGASICEQMDSSLWAYYSAARPAPF